LPFTGGMQGEVNHAGVGLGYRPVEWPTAFVDRALPFTIDRLERKGASVTGPAASWHLHRTDGDGEWLIRRAPDGSTVTTEHAKADAAVRGTGAGILEWLLGRWGARAAGIGLLGAAAYDITLSVVFV